MSAPSTTLPAREPSRCRAMSTPGSISVHSQTTRLASPGRLGVSRHPLPGGEVLVVAVAHACAEDLGDGLPSPQRHRRPQPLAEARLLVALFHAVVHLHVYAPAAGCLTDLYSPQNFVGEISNLRSHCRQRSASTGSSAERPRAA